MHSVLRLCPFLVGDFMDIRKFQLLLDIAETGNLTASGQRTGYSQSGVSHSIKNLENELGFCLLKRNNKGVMLTSEAKMIMPKIRSLVTQYSQLNEIIDSIHGLEKGSLVIATYSSVAIQWLPLIIHKFQENYPKISLQIKEGGTEEIEEWIQNGMVDFGFYSSFPTQKSEFIPLKKDEIFAVLPPDYELDDACSKSFPLETFSNIPFIASEMGIDFDIAGVLSYGNINPPIRFYCRDDHSIISMIQHGLGVTLLPGLVLEGYESKIKILPINPRSYRTLGIGIIAKEQLSSAAVKFINYAKSMLESF